MGGLATEMRDFCLFFWGMEIGNRGDSNSCDLAGGKPFYFCTKNSFFGIKMISPEGSVPGGAYGAV